jgi:hypothetical protein
MNKWLHIYIYKFHFVFEEDVKKNKLTLRKTASGYLSLSSSNFGAMTMIKKEQGGNVSIRKVFDDVIKSDR